MPVYPEQTPVYLTDEQKAKVVEKIEEARALLVSFGGTYEGSLAVSGCYNFLIEAANALKKYN